MAKASCHRGWKAFLWKAVLVALVGWPMLDAGAADPSTPLSDNSFGWLCRGLPLDSVWGPPTTAAEADKKRCAATFFLGIENDTGGEHMFGIKKFIPPYEYKLDDSYFIGGSLLREIGEIGPFLAYEVETGAGQRFGTLHEEDVWVAIYARWKYFPWNEFLRTSAAVSTGLNYASGVPNLEVRWSDNNRGQRLLHYLSPEITFGLPAMPDTDFVIRSHHRSGGGAIWGNDVPIYGSLFHGTAGGAQYLTAGIRQHF